MGKNYLALLEKSSFFHALGEIVCQPGEKWCIGGCQSALSFILSQLFRKLGKFFLVVLADEQKAERFYQDVTTFLEEKNILFFPPPNFFPEKQGGYTEEMAERMKVFVTLSTEKKPFFVVSCLAGILPLVPAQAEVRQTKIVLSSGASVLRSQLLEQLFRYGYEEKEIVEIPGEFARRGGIIDLFPPDSPFPLRLELFGEKLHSLRRFQASTQVSFERVAEVILYPLSEHHIPVKDLVPITSWFNDGVIFLVESSKLQDSDHSGRETGTPLMNQEQLSQLKSRAVICQSNFTSEINKNFVQLVTPFTRERFRLGEVFLWDRYREERLLIFSNNSSQEQRLKEILAEKGINLEQTEFLRGSLSSSFSFPEIGITFLSNDELFSRYQSRHSRKRQVEDIPLGSWEELKVGDYVVHYNEGIGRFLGLKKMFVGEKEEEFIVLEYAGGDKLYVPIAQIAFIHKYIGSSHPVLSRLGTRAWKQTRYRVEKAIRDLASELYSLYLERKKEKGFAFPPDDEWQKAFEDGFLFEETPDQSQTIKEVKQDMMSEGIMDRLVCGDSGYGKTEVAMRAAFKAVLSGRQVAVLVPTTVLALQHYLTFKERMADFPVQVAMLCRLVPEAEQRQILKKLKDGQIDIIIGTHRLLSGDVCFRSLGLLIIDEEQRLGVTHKEHLKSMFRRVDVLTLTATPIPRTLYLSLSGIRDISLIETPPLGRISVVTYVGRMNRRLISEAVRREMERGGQVFYLHNFVCDIEKVAENIQHLIPEARISIAHGQMPGKVIEKVMESFAAGEIDVLVATTIVENGVDIPRANTLIVDNAHRFGLADLYQLRGRVGRYKWRAYAYFLVPDNLVLSSEARARLEALQELNQPGSGFRVALRDLEIRGAGNILGYQQHGFIQQVGFHLYCQFWKNIAAALRGQKVVQPGEVFFQGSIPAEYISSPRLRFWAYRKIAELEPNQIEGFLEELRDRFGPVPEEIQQLVLTAARKR